MECNSTVTGLHTLHVKPYSAKIYLCPAHVLPQSPSTMPCSPSPPQKPSRVSTSSVALQSATCPPRIEINFWEQPLAMAASASLSSARAALSFAAALTGGVCRGRRRNFENSKPKSSELAVTAALAGAWVTHTTTAVRAAPDKDSESNGTKSPKNRALPPCLGIHPD